MGFIAQVLAFIRGIAGNANLSEVQVDPGGGANESPEHYADAGDDSYPLPSDFATGFDVPGRKVVVGYADPLSIKKAGPGEKRMYSRKADGTPVAEIWCKDNGTIVIEALEAGAPIEINTTGPVIVNSTDIRLGSEAGRRVALIGDQVQCTLHGLTPSGPVTPGVPAPGAGVPVAGKIVGAGSRAAKG